jgi:hypothetical protein
VINRHGLNAVGIGGSSPKEMHTSQERLKAQDWHCPWGRGGVGLSEMRYA